MSQLVEQRMVVAAPRSVAARIAAIRSWTFAREVALMAALFLGYRQIRFLTRNDTDQALANAERVLDVQHGWFVTERAVQDVAMKSELLIGFLNRYYVGVHFPITILFVAWLLVRQPRWYRTMRNWLIGVTAAALAIHVAFPLAPPRMTDGFVDTLDVYGPDIYPADHTQSVANQFAAMPSLHFGWSVIVAVGFIVVVRNRWRWLALAHPLVTLLAIVATANHYWLDAAVAGLLVLAAALAIRPLREVLAHTVRKNLTRSTGADGDAVPDSCLELLTGHEEPAVAGDGEHGCRRVREPGPDRGRQCVAHRARRRSEIGERAIPALEPCDPAAEVPGVVHEDRLVGPAFAQCHRQQVLVDEAVTWPGHGRGLGLPPAADHDVAAAARRAQSILEHPSLGRRREGGEEHGLVRP